MKKTISLLAVLALVLSLSLAPMCAAYESVETVYSDLGNGITMETTTTLYDLLLRSNSRTASRTATFKNNGVEIATVTLTATFGFDGSRAWVVSASGSHTVESGWTYRNQSISNSGGTSNLTAEIRSTKVPGILDVDISLTCSRNGEIS